MEKTIKNCIWELFTIKSGIKNELQQADSDKKETDEEQIEFLNYAIDIIKKYQSIEKIIEDHDNDRIPEDFWYIDKIREVVEDGN